ncbi:MAG: transcriptional regulator [Armatimonadetes bacterium]|nr:transcriptional regulator [Anaerolineae bacterium]
MSMQDVSARLKAVRKPGEDAASERVYDHEESYRLRAKMLGVLLRDARMAAMRTVEDCARLLRVEPGLIEAWEYADAVPSLPQLELLAYYLDVPMSHFWSMETLAGKQRPRMTAQEEYLHLRQRMVGALLRAAREDAKLSVEAVAESTHLAAATITAYELGEQAMPMNELSSLASAVNKNIGYFLESSSQIGELLATRENWKHFNGLPEDLRRFAANPLNIGFIEIALMFSQMPIDKLKNVATSMLDITGY